MYTLFFFSALRAVLWELNGHWLFFFRASRELLYKKLPPVLSERQLLIGFLHCAPIAPFLITLLFDLLPCLLQLFSLDVN
jgi:hypothetical protein